MKKYFLLTLAVVATIAACNKKPEVKAGRQDMLRSGKWSIASGTVVIKLPNGKDTTLNYLDYLPVCRRDDYMKFMTGIDGAIFTSGNKCSAADPDSTHFSWQFTNNETVLSMYNGFDFIYGIKQYIMPFRFDTLQQNPYLILDTIYGHYDTPHLSPIIVLDTIWEVRYDSVNLKYNNLYNAKVVDFSESSFTLNFSVYSTYPDTTGYHTGKYVYINPVTAEPDSIDFDPILRPDTLKYTIKYIKN